MFLFKIIISISTGRDRMDQNISKRKVQADSTKKRILESAVKNFARYGYHKTTVDDIAKQIHMTTGAIYHHFSSKEDILFSVIEWLARGMRGYAEYLNQAESSSDAVQGIISLMISHFERQPEATICLATLATEFAGTEHIAKNRLIEIYEDFVNAFQRCVKNHPYVGNSNAAAIAFIGAVQGIAVQGLLRQDQIHIKDLAENFFDMLCRWNVKDNQNKQYE